MQLSEVLDKISKVYIPGTIAFFSKMNPDPWEQMNLEMENSLSNDWDQNSLFAERYVTRAIELIETYKKLSPSRKAITPVDAFMIGSIDSIEAWRSVKHKSCKICGISKGLKLRTRADDPNRVEVVCTSCAEKKSA